MVGHGACVPGTSPAAVRRRDQEHCPLHRQAHGIGGLNILPVVAAPQPGAQRRRGGGLAHAWLLGALCLAMPMPAPADEITAKVARVLSGDTLVVADGKGELEIRLADIGAPRVANITRRPRARCFRTGFQNKRCAWCSPAATDQTARSGVFSWATSMSISS